MNIFDYLPSDEAANEAAKRFDTLLVQSSRIAQSEALQDIATFEDKIHGIGRIGAKMLYMRIHDLVILDDNTRAQSRRHGEWLVKLQQESKK